MTVQSISYKKTHSIMVELMEKERELSVAYNQGKSCEIQVDANKAEQNETVGLTKDQLMEFVDDPFWKTLRSVLFISFWALWIAMLGSSVAIIFMTPGCAPIRSLAWFEKTPIYTIDKQRFTPAGDWASICDKGDYFKDIGVNAIAFHMNNVVPPADEPDNADFHSNFHKLSEKMKVVLRLHMESLEQNVVRLQENLEAWIKLGVSGFIFDDVSQSLEQTKTLQELYHGITLNTTTGEPLLFAISSNENAPDKYCRFSNMLLTKDLVQLSPSFTSQDLAPVLDSDLNKQTNGSCTRGVVLGIQNFKLYSRYDNDRADILTIFTMMLSDTPILYFGDEYGMVKGAEQMDWKLAMDKSDDAPTKLFRTMSKMRKSEASILRGETNVRSVEDVISVTRIKAGNPGFVAVSCIGASGQQVNLRNLDKQIPLEGQIVARANSKRPLNTKISLDNLHLGPMETLVIQFVPESLEAGAGH